MAGRGRLAPNCIVQPNELLTEDEIRDEEIVFTDLAFVNTLDCIKWFVKRGLLSNRYMCEACQIPMSFVVKARLSDGYEWKCKQCGSNVTIRKNSFFQGSHLSLKQLVIIIYGWSRDYPQKDIAHEARLNQSTCHTIVDWCSFCRDVCEQYLIDHPNEIGGLDEDGSFKEVEIDESKFSHRKYHRGEWREGHWVFGGVERRSGKCFLVEVPNRSRETLEEIIQRFILPGTVIVSDGWRAYNHLDQIGGGIYEHRVIVHQQNFVDPQDGGIHTQNVENMWMRAKRKLRRQFGTSETLFPSYLHEFLWRNQFKRTNLFGQFLICIRQQYPVWV